MSLKCLAVDCDFDVSNAYVQEWNNRNIEMDCVSDMTEAIEKLLSQKDYIFIGINGDATDYMPLLQTMRSVTHFPIFIVTRNENFTTDNEVAALNNGADLYARWHLNPIDNVASVLAHINRLSVRSKMPRPVTNIMVYKNLLIAPLSRRVFVGNKEIKLTRKDFDLLHFLMVNYGIVMTYTQIYKRVWGGDYIESEHYVLWNVVKRVRGKLKDAPGGIDYIETVRDYGYRFPNESDE